MSRTIHYRLVVTRSEGGGGGGGGGLGQNAARCLL